MTTFPKLRYPISTKGLNQYERAIILAYDMIYRARSKALATMDTDEDYKHDLSANLANLGHCIEHSICGGDMSLRFDGFDEMIEPDPVFAQPTDVLKKEWQDIVEDELKK